MPRPNASLATLRPDLDSSFEEFSLEQDRLGFIGLKVAPVIEAKVAGGTFGRIPVEQLLQKRTTARNARGGYSRGDWEFEPDSFATKEHGAEEPLDDSELATFNEFDVEQYSAERARDVVLRNYEQEVCDGLSNTSVWTPTAITNEWDDFTNATPVNDVLTAKKAVWAACGLWPNALVINRNVFLNLRECAQVLERIKYAGFDDPKSASITAAVLAQLFDLEHVIISGSAKNTADKGLAMALSPLWSDEYAMVCRVAETSDPKEPCVARTIHWGGDGSKIDGTTEEYRDETTRGGVVRVRHQRQFKVMYKECAHLLSNITT